MGRRERHLLAVVVDHFAASQHAWKVGRLAVAKLQPEILPGRPLGDILLEQRRGESDCDFVEVHVFGHIHRLVIERIVGPEPKKRADRTTWKQIMRKAKELGAKVEVTP